MFAFLAFANELNDVTDVLPAELKEKINENDHENAAAAKWVGGEQQCVKMCNKQYLGNIGS